MKKRILIETALTAICFCVAGCAAKVDVYPFDPYNSAPRLVIQGTVSNEDGEALTGINVTETNVRELIEEETITYNYAITDASGQYTIIRYRGRELPTEVCVVTMDPDGVYKQDTSWVPVQYDTIITYNGKEPYNGFVTADFVLKRK